MKGTHLWRLQRKGYVGTWEEGDLARGTHELGPTDRERMRLSESPHLWRPQRDDMPGHKKNTALRGALTN